MTYILRLCHLYMMHYDDKNDVYIMYSRKSYTQIHSTNRKSEGFTTKFVFAPLLSGCSVVLWGLG